MVCFDSLGIFPGLLIEYVGEKKATIWGGIMIVIAKILIVLLLDDTPSGNSYFLLFIISFLGG